MNNTPAPTQPTEAERLLLIDIAAHVTCKEWPGAVTLFRQHVVHETAVKDANLKRRQEIIDAQRVQIAKLREALEITTDALHCAENITCCATHIQNLYDEKERAQVAAALATTPESAASELAELREQNRVLRIAQKACADCDAPTAGEIAELRKDKERVDWMGSQCDDSWESFGHYKHASSLAGTGYAFDPATPFYYGDIIKHFGADLRAAIDAARSTPASK